jgi:hypothetical protein
VLEAGKRIAVSVDGDASGRSVDDAAPGRLTGDASGRFVGHPRYAGLVDHASAGPVSVNDASVGPEHASEISGFTWRAALETVPPAFIGTAEASDPRATR